MSWEEFFNKGKEHIEKGDYDKAIKCFEKALEECPEEEKWVILANLALCYRLKEDYDKAVGKLEEILKLNPNDKKVKSKI